MSIFVISRTGFLLMLAVLVVLDVFFYPVHFVIYLLLILAFILLVVVGSSSMSFQFFTKAYTRILTKDKVIALTFDDGPHPDYTPAILELLEQYNAKATFFCIGKNIDNNKQLSTTIKNKGHELGNHSWSHSPMFSLFGKNKVKEELIHTNNLISEITGSSCKLFRPPYGVTNPPIAKALKSLPLKTIGWSIRSFDTTTKNSEKIINRVLPQIKPGAIILLHDNRSQTIKILEAILLYTSKNNYKCVSITDEITLK